MSTKYQVKFGVNDNIIVNKTYDDINTAITVYNAIDINIPSLTTEFNIMYKELNFINGDTVECIVEYDENIYENGGLCGYGFETVHISDNKLIPTNPLRTRLLATLEDGRWIPCKPDHNF